LPQNSIHFNEIDFASFRFSVLGARSAIPVSKYLSIPWLQRNAFGFGSKPKTLLRRFPAAGCIWSWLD
jgi:hypothetical protein